MKGRLPAIALVAVLLVAWEVYVRLAAVDPVVLPSPSRRLTISAYLGFCGARRAMLQRAPRRR